MECGKLKRGTHTSEKENLVRQPSLHILFDARHHELTRLFNKAFHLHIRCKMTLYFHVTLHLNYQRMLCHETLLYTIKKSLKSRLVVQNLIIALSRVFISFDMNTLLKAILKSTYSALSVFSILRILLDKCQTNSFEGNEHSTKKSLD